MVGQLLGHEIEARPLVELLQLDHRVAAVAAVAMEMLEEAERGGAPAVEQVDIALLGQQQVALAEISGEPAEGRSARAP